MKVKFIPGREWEGNSITNLKNSTSICEVNDSILKKTFES